MIRCIHLYTGTDGRSHVEETTLPLGVAQAASAVHFEETAAGSALDWHTAPRKIPHDHEKAQKNHEKVEVKPRMKHGFWRKRNR